MDEVEKKYKQAMESNAQLEKEKSQLMSKVDELQGSLQQMSNKCAEATRVSGKKCALCSSFRNNVKTRNVNVAC